MFEFQATPTLSAPPGSVTLEAVTVGAWQPRDRFPGGCCARTRTVTVRVDVPSEDPWAGAELVAAWDLWRPTQLEEPLEANLDLQFGEGQREFTVVQWDDEGHIQPPCVSLHARNAAGVRGPGLEVCATSNGPSATVDGVEQARGCSHTPMAAGWFEGWALLERRSR